ncbi:MAG: hypothetical protein HKO63_10965 [Acidimicrobiia bacterium]|nr:hypothetical protein [Acidimicrobiia bacterium]MBT8191953.1 hypothetical protein [Acidimicrobiia bacterium]NNF87554.1 hypothetical protein [Acidimicrobiia bacterium]NNL13957.1 hypothetical protein [Acidimicrobiia bacterium]NNL98714.1 hypothetical protein [Acidimicrobiia bacterium]
MKDTTYRFIYAGLGIALVAVVGLAVAFSPSGTETPLPEPVERIFPLPNDSVIRQTALEIDMQVGYEIVLFVDGFRISPVEIGVQTGTNRYVWEPAPGRFLETWEPGTHEITIEWDRISGIPDPGSYSWSFRVQ